MFEHLKIAKNTMYQIIARVASSGASFIIAIVIARHFDILGYGDYAKVTAFVTLFYLLADFGFNAVFLQAEDSRLHFRDLFYARMILAVSILIFVNILATFLPFNPITGVGFDQTVRLGIVIFSLSILTEGILVSSAAIFQRELRYDLFMLSTIVGSIAALFFTSIVTIAGLPLMYIFAGLVLGAVIESTSALLFTKESIFPLIVDHRFIRRLIKDTLPLTLMLVFNAIYFRVDMILLSLLKSTTDVAIYDIAYKFFDFLIALPLFLSNALYPGLLEKEKNSRITKQRVRIFIFAFFLLAIPVVVVMWVLSPLIQLIKPEFLPAALPLRILVASLPIFFATSILQWILIVKKKQNFLAFVYFFSTIVNIMLNVILIPRFSYLASAAITGISESMVLIILWILVEYVD